MEKTKKETQGVSWIKSFSRQYGIVFVLIVMVIVSSLLTPKFYHPQNIINIARQISITTVMSFGALLLIVAGMIDLSAGSVMAFAGMIGVTTYLSTSSMLLAVIVSIIVGVVMNLISGVVVTVFKIPAFIVTMAMQTIARGAVYLYTGGNPIYQVGNLNTLSGGYFMNIPYPVWIMLIVAVITWFLTNRFRFGRYVYAIGGNEGAAIASGIQANKVKIGVFAFNGFVVGLAGIMLMSRLNAGLPQAGEGYEFDAISSAFIGGTSVTGGSGTVLGTLVGAFIMGILSNILNLMGVNSYVQQILKGIIIVLAVILDGFVKGQGKKKMMKKK